MFNFFSRVSSAWVGHHLLEQVIFSGRSQSTKYPAFYQVIHLSCAGHPFFINQINRHLPWVTCLFYKVAHLLYHAIFRTRLPTISDHVFSRFVSYLAPPPLRSFISCMHSCFPYPSLLTVTVRLWLHNTLKLLISGPLRGSSIRNPLRRRSWSRTGVARGWRSWAAAPFRSSMRDSWNFSPVLKWWSHHFIGKLHRKDPDKRSQF